jgi:hypothetical protein
MKSIYQQIILQQHLISAASRVAAKHNLQWREIKALTLHGLQALQVPYSNKLWRECSAEVSNRKCNLQLAQAKNRSERRAILRQRNSI